MIFGDLVRMFRVRDL